LRYLDRAQSPDKSVFNIAPKFNSESARILADANADQLTSGECAVVPRPSEAIQNPLIP
jgi:hypothetical protein